MKLRIRDNSLRLRITQTELRTFESDKKVSCTINFPGGNAMTYDLIWSDDNEFSASYDGNTMTARVAKDAGLKWIEPTEVTMDERLDLENGESLRLLIEKDFQCLSERKDEDESDMFPNPNPHC